MQISFFEIGDAIQPSGLRPSGHIAPPISQNSVRIYQCALARLIAFLQCCAIAMQHNDLSTMKIKQFLPNITFPKKMAIGKKSQIFVQYLWKLVKMITSWANHFYQVSWRFDRNCGFFIPYFWMCTVFSYSDLSLMRKKNHQVMHF